MYEQSPWGSIDCRADRRVDQPLRTVIVALDPVAHGLLVHGQAACLDVIDRYDTIEGAALPVAACLPDIALVAFDPELTSPDRLSGLARRSPTTMLAAVTPGALHDGSGLIAAGVFSWYPASTPDLARGLVADHVLFRRSSHGLTVLAPVASRVSGLVAAS